MKYHWLLFDLDNTLFDFDAASHYALETTFRDFGIDPSEEHKSIYYKINHKCWTDFENGKLDFATLRNIRFQRFLENVEVHADAVQMSTWFF